MSEKDAKQSQLRQSLGLFDAVAISVGAIIGAGIFVVTGIVAGLAGSALVVSMLVAAAVSLFTALSFAELTAWQPREGSIYEYTYQLISPFAGFLTGWMWILSNTFSGAAVSLGFAYYLTAVFPVFPASWVAAVICLAFTVLNFFGIRESALINNVLVVAKLVILALFVVVGFVYFDSANLVPFAPFDVGVLYGACYIFFAYGGFARVAIVAEEVKHAKRNVPRAILLSLVISTVVYLLVGVVAVGLIGASQLAGSNSPLADAIGVTQNSAVIYVVSLGGLLATASVLLTSILGVSRVAYAMARRDDLPKALGRLHGKYNTPYYSIWIFGLIATLLVLFFDLSGVVAISSFALLFYYTLANVSAFRLKVEKRAHHRIIAAVGAVSCFAMLVFLLFVSLQAWLVGGLGLLAGAVYYVAKQRLSQ